MVKPAAEQLPKKPLIHVLHVDDEPNYLKTAKTILEMQKTFQVETASSVEEAMKKLETKNFDVIISDYIMPGIDGLEFLRELRASGNTTPFIIFTGKGREIVAIKALNLGADQYINKIGNPEAVYSELSHGIRTVVKGKKAEEALRNSEKEKSAVLDGMSEFVVHQDLKHRILWANSKAADCANMTPEEVKGRYCYEVWANRATPCIGCPLEEAIKTGQPQQGETTTLDGRILSIMGSPIKDANGQVMSIVEVAANISEQKKAEEELRKSEARYRGLIENIGNGIVTIDLEGRYTFVNQMFCEIVGYSKKELIGKQFTDLLHPDDKERMLQQFSGSGEDPDRKLSVEFRLLHKNGKIIYMSSSPTPIIYNNKIVGFNAIHSNVTEQKKAEEALQESEEKYRNVLEQAPDMILTVNEKGIITSCNSILEQNTDFSRNEVVGKYFLDTPLLNEVNPETAQQVFKSILKGKNPERIKIKWFRKDGTPHISELRIGLNKKDGKITGFTVIARDITEQKKAEETKEKLTESEEKFRNLAENSPNMIFINNKGKVVYANKRCEEIMGYKKEEFYSPDFKFFTLIAPESVEKLKSSYSTHLKGKEVHPFEYTLLTKEGKRIEAVLASKLINYEGETAILGIITDITKYKQMEKQLKDSEEKYRNVVELSPDGMISLDMNGIVTSVNRATLTQTGFSEKDFLGKHFTQLTAVPSENLSELTKKIDSVMKGDTTEVLEFSYCCKDGTQLVAEASAGLLKHKGEPYGLQLILRDITERKRAEEKLRDSEKKFRTISDSAQDSMILIDESGKIVYWNPAAEKAFGYTKKEAIGKELHSFVAPERFYGDYQRGFMKFKETGKGSAVGKTLELFAKRKDGTEIPIELSLSALKIKGKWCATGIVRDITERKEAEEKLDRMMDEMVAINEKLGVIGKLTRHDVRNKLTVIANNTYLAKMKMATRPDALEHLRDIELAVYQMEKIFDFARNYEMLGTEELSYVDVKKSFDEAFLLLSCPDNIKPVTECEGLKVRADSLLRQIFYNLIDNSVKYGDKVSHIKVYCIEKEDSLKLLYEDDGVGIPTGEKEKIFMEGVGKGTGYGLYLIRKICENYGWTIKETGVPNKGAQFTMTIPHLNKKGKPNYTQHK